MYVSNHVFHVAVVGVFGKPYIVVVVTNSWKLDYEPCVPITQRAKEPANVPLICVGMVCCLPIQLMVTTLNDAEHAAVHPGEDRPEEAKLCPSQVS